MGRHERVGREVGKEDEEIQILCQYTLTMSQLRRYNTLQYVSDISDKVQTQYFAELNFDHKH